MRRFPFPRWQFNYTLRFLFLGLVAFGFTAGVSRGTPVLSSLATAQTAAADQSAAAAQNSAGNPDPATTQKIKSELKQSTLDQTAVRERTAAVVAQVQGLIDELAANGITGDDAKVLQATRAALAHLSGPEMDRVIASLQQAGTATNAAETAHHAVNAYVTQKGIVLQFRMILKEYQDRQSLEELQARFKELTERQTTAMRTTADVARTAMGRNLNELSTMELTTQQIVQTDQAAIANETNLAGEQLDQAADGVSGDEAPPLQKAREEMKNGHLRQVLAQANDDLNAGYFLKAIDEQSTARNELHRITLDLNPPADPAEAIAQTAADLGKLIAEQKALLAQTNSAINAHTAVAGLNDRQGVLVDEANVVQQDIAQMNGPAAGLIQEAIDPPMQTSRGQLRDLGGFPGASTAQQAAIAKLEAAQKLLQDQLTAEETRETNEETAKDNEPAPDPTALTTAANKIDEAETNVGLALNDTPPPEGMPPGTNPPMTNSPTGNPPDGNPPTGTPPAGNPPPTGTPPTTMPDALKDLTKAETQVNDVSNTPDLPDTTKDALKDANNEITKGKEAASNGDAPGTEAHAGAAMTALIQAQSTLALAMSGLPGTGTPGVPGPTGPPMPTPPGPTSPSPNGALIVGGGSNEKPTPHEVSDHSETFIAMQVRIRGALVSTGTEPRPQEYAPLIDQYLKNLADQSSAQ